MIYLEVRLFRKPGFSSLLAWFIQVNGQLKNVV